MDVLHSSCAVSQEASSMCREEILQAITCHQVVLVAGKTGCGKTTQVPQFILEDAWGEVLLLRLQIGTASQ